MGGFQPHRPRDVSREKLVELAKDAKRKESAYQLLAELNQSDDLEKRIDASAEMTVAKDEWLCAESIYRDAERDYAASLRIATWKETA